MRTLFAMLVIYLICSFLVGGFIDLRILLGNPIGRVIIILWVVVSYWLVCEPAEKTTNP